MKNWSGSLQKIFSWSLMGLGISLLMFGLVTLVADTTQPSITYAQDDDEDVEYIGESECTSCHRELGRSHTESRHALTLQEASRNEEAIVGDFSKGEDVRTVQFPGEDNPRAFTPEDIAYTVGTGRYVQRYLYEVDRNEYLVFPAEWNVATQEWQPFTLAETWDESAYSWNKNCGGCHTTGLNADRGKWEGDGVQCEACHGPGSVHAEEADDAGDDPGDRDLVKIRESIVLSPDAQICGQCHSRGVATDEFQFPVGYLPGQTLTDSFTLTATDDPVHWWATGQANHANMQYNEWLKSTHATALTSVQGSNAADTACLDCHSADYQWNQSQIASVEAGERPGDPPEPLSVDTAQFGVTCTTCHRVHAENNPEFLLTQDTYTLCTDCHQNTGEEIHHPVKEMYEGLAVVENVEAVPSSHFTAENGPTCVTCHMSDVPIDSGSRSTHTFQPVIGDGSENTPPDSCTSCHTDLTPDYIQKFVTDAQAEVSARLDAASTSLAAMSEPPAWMQTVLDFVEGDGSQGIHNYAYTDALLDAVEVELGLVQLTTTTASSSFQAIDPAECEECHRDEHRQWAASPHASASQTNTFLRDFASQGRPGYCMNCHGSGYNPDTSSHAFEGVVCTSCHTIQSGVEHPPSPVEIGTSAEVCGKCHSGAHAPTYDEWLVSAHNKTGIDCVDCHTAHNNGLVLGDVNQTCGSCHQEALTDPVHMGEEMDCVDCHMARKVADDGIHVVNTGHSMLIDPGVCADCHGNTHLLSVRESNSINEQDVPVVEQLQTEVEELRNESEDKRNAGIVGGALGAVLVMIALGMIWRMRVFL